MYGTLGEGVGDGEQALVPATPLAKVGLPPLAKTSFSGVIGGVM